ncbi:hypothetical protein FLGE108171_14610 [Flavobacterium gelidilacus]|uniref:hypothetical protein n=1 Tax=Flavobacterium gelidilacus TaxID=206041 RepID=UPI00041D6C9B|nr:hypothetical protein [Flavobacterium gelidilacus]
MNKLKWFLLILFFIVQNSFCQKTEDLNYENAKKAYLENNYTTANSYIKQSKIAYKSVPPKVSYLEIMIKDELIKSNPYEDYSLLDETRNLVNIYLKKYQNLNGRNYKDVEQVANRLISLPKDLTTFNYQKEKKIKEEELEKERIKIEAAERKEKLEREAKAKEERERVLRVEALEREKLNSLINERRIKLAPYAKAIRISDYELSELSELEFIHRLNKAKEDLVKIEKEEAKVDEIRIQRSIKLKPYNSQVSYSVINSLGTYSSSEFDEIYNKAKKDFKATKKRNKPNLRPFSSLGFQSGEIANYGLIYESGGKTAIGFRLSARTSLTPEEDILNGTIIKNKTEIELGPNIKIFKRLYLNLGAGYGYYDRIINNDYSNEISLEKTGYSVATTGLMIRLSGVININGGVSFMDIEKDFYKPEVTFGISFNLKGRYKY